MGDFLPEDLIYTHKIKRVMKQFRQQIEQGLEHRLERVVEREPCPTVAIVSPGEVKDYARGFYRGSRDLMITTSPDIPANIPELYLHVGEGGLDTKELEKILERHSRFASKREITLVSVGYSDEQIRALAELSTRYVLPVIIIPFQELIPKQLKIIADDIRMGKPYQQIVEEQIGRTYL